MSSIKLFLKPIVKELLIHDEHSLKKNDSNGKYSGYLAPFVPTDIDMDTEENFDEKVNAMVHRMVEREVTTKFVLNFCGGSFVNFLYLNVQNELGKYMFLYIRLYN